MSCLRIRKFSLPEPRAAQSGPESGGEIAVSTTMSSSMSDCCCFFVSADEVRDCLTTISLKTRHPQGGLMLG